MDDEPALGVDVDPEEEVVVELEPDPEVEPEDDVVVEPEVDPVDGAELALSQAPL